MEVEIFLSMTPKIVLSWRQQPEKEREREREREREGPPNVSNKYSVEIISAQKN